MSVRQQLFPIVFVLLQLASRAVTEQEEFSKVLDRLVLLEKEIISNRQLILQMQQSLNQFSQESVTMFSNLNAVLTRVDARTEGFLNKMQHNQLGHCEPTLQLKNSTDQFLGELNTSFTNFNATLSMGNATSDILSEAQRAQLEIILANPQAILFTETNKTGNNEYYDFNSSTSAGGCYDIQIYPKKFKSVATIGKCVRLFSSPACLGFSQAFYPGSSIEFHSKLKGVQSVGPCVDNEFDFAKIKKTESSVVEVEKFENSNTTTYKGVPNLIGDVYTRVGLTSVRSNSTPIKDYLLGPGSRIEALLGTIYPSHIRTPADAESNRIVGQHQSFYNNLGLNGTSSDEASFAFPLELGGHADQIYNVFPQDRTQAEKYRQTFVPAVKQFLADNPSGKVFLGLTFLYNENSTSLRPTGIWYRINFSTESIKDIRYGYFPN